jgi:hypothetical protein
MCCSLKFQTSAKCLKPSHGASEYIVCGGFGLFLNSVNLLLGGEISTIINPFFWGVGNLLIKRVVGKI